MPLPGLGVEVNKELVLEENKTPHYWKNPVWRHATVSVAEWQFPPKRATGFTRGGEVCGIIRA